MVRVLHPCCICVPWSSRWEGGIALAIFPHGVGEVDKGAGACWVCVGEGAAAGARFRICCGPTVCGAQGGGAPAACLCTASAFPLSLCHALCSPHCHCYQPFSAHYFACTPQTSSVPHPAVHLPGRARTCGWGGGVSALRACAVPARGGSCGPVCKCLAHESRVSVAKLRDFQRITHLPWGCFSLLQHQTRPHLCFLGSVSGSTALMACNFRTPLTKELTQAHHVSAREPVPGDCLVWRTPCPRGRGEG